MADREAARIWVGVARESTGAVRALVSKIGGRPVGLPAARWPLCRQCGRPMEFLVQWSLHEPLRLSSKYAFAYLFMCHGYMDRRGSQQCSTFLPDSGANRLVLVEHPDHRDCPEPLGIKQWPEFVIEYHQRSLEELEETDNGNPLSRLGEFADLLREAQAKAEAEGVEAVEVVLPEHWAHDDEQGVVLIGGEPRWIQSDETPRCPICGGPMVLLAQVKAEVRRQGSGGGVLLPFGSGGAAYVFMCGKECSLDATAVLWQTT